MITWKPVFAATVAVALMASTASAQQTDYTFGYPASVGDCGQDCGTAGRGQGRFANFHAKMDHFKALNKKKYARNDAWPKPFSCWDKRAYHEFWTPYLDQGLHDRCIIAADFFDPETHELTKLGIHQVAGIMQTVAEKDRSIFIQRAANDMVNQARMQAVKSTIDTYYAHHGLARVDLTNRAPRMITGVMGQTMQQKRLDTLTDPVIETPTGGSVNQAVTGGQ